MLHRTNAAGHSMKFLSRLLGPRKHGAPQAAAAEHIARAFSAGGLDHATGGSHIRSTIDRALEAAGLQPAAGAPAETKPRTPARTARPARGAPGPQGQFLHQTFANAHGRRDYRLYLPAGYDGAGAPRPLIVMLHGCTQSAEDFAVGTRMNALADRHGFLVAYPQQIGNANHAKCWNWFRPEDQRGDAGEPSVLGGIARQVAGEYRVDPRRIFVAGLSAGAAMAVILARTQPDLVRAVGVHSGLPYASAHDVPSAFAVMQGRSAGAARASSADTVGVPMILFHGDADRTVAPVNADTLAAAALNPGLYVVQERGANGNGHAYTREIATDASGIRRFERWTVHGAGHAWSGGDAAGSYTDPAGPDASAAMVAFFLQQDPASPPTSA